MCLACDPLTCWLCCLPISKTAKNQQNDSHGEIQNPCHLRAYVERPKGVKRICLPFGDSREKIEV
jgi:hypothetical protein